MPYKSDRQRRYFHANRKQLEQQGVNVEEWDMASKGLDLPETAKDKQAGSLPFVPMRKSAFIEGLAAQTVRVAATDHGQFFINNQKLAADQALTHLTVDLCVPLSQAMDVLDSARFKHRESRYWLKQAEQIPPPPRANFPVLPESIGVGGGDGPGAVTYNMETPQSGMQTLPMTAAPLVNNPNAAYVDPMMGTDQQQAMQPDAPQAEFELSALESLANTNRIDQPLSKTTSTLLQSMNQLGQMLFLLYAAPEEFKDRFGREDTETIENLLITQFETAGDLYVKLRQGEQNPGSSLVSPDANQPLEER